LLWLRILRRSCVAKEYFYDSIRVGRNIKCTVYVSYNEHIDNTFARNNVDSNNRNIANIGHNP